MFVTALYHRILEPEESNDAGYFRLRPDDVINHIGKDKAEKLGKEMQLLRQAEGNLCKATPLSFAKMTLFFAVSCAAKSEDKLKLVKKKRKTLKRTEFTMVHSKLFGKVDDASGEFRFYS